MNKFIFSIKKTYVLGVAGKAYLYEIVNLEQNKVYNKIPDFQKRVDSGHIKKTGKGDFNKFLYTIIFMYNHLILHAVVQ